MSEREIIEALRRAREEILRGKKPEFITANRGEFIVLDWEERTRDVRFLLANRSGELCIMQCFRRGLEDQIRQINDIVMESKLPLIDVYYVGARIQYINSVKEYNGNLKLDYEYGVTQHSPSQIFVWIHVLDKASAQVRESWLATCSTKRSEGLLRLPDGSLIKFTGNVRRTSSGNRVIDLMYYEVIEESASEVEEVKEGKEAIEETPKGIGEVKAEVDVDERGKVVVTMREVEEAEERKDIEDRWKELEEEVKKLEEEIKELSRR